MRIARLISCAAAATMLSSAPAFAQGRGGGHASPTAAHGNPHTATPAKTTATTTSTGGTSTGTTSTSPTTSSTTTTPMNPIAQKISSHPQLATKLTPLLPTGMTLNQASSGFRNQGQFIAALHVSKNLKIPFAQLKATMLGTSTGTATATSTTENATNPMSLGQAIHKLRPTADADTEAQHATVQASVDVKTTTTTTTSTSIHQ
jgi:hypothetical protein